MSAPPFLNFDDFRDTYHEVEGGAVGDHRYGDSGP